MHRKILRVLRGQAVGASLLVLGARDRPLRVFGRGRQLRPALPGGQHGVRRRVHRHLQPTDLRLVCASCAPRKKRTQYTLSGDLESAAHLLAAPALVPLTAAHKQPPCRCKI